MHITRLQIKPAPGAKGELELWLDDTRFSEHVQTFEREQYPHSAGITNAARSALVSQDRVAGLLDYAVHRTVLTCACGDEDCGSKMVRIQAYGDYVVWDALTDMHASFDKQQADYQDPSRFPAITFDKAQYEAAVQAALAGYVQS